MKWMYRFGLAAVLAFVSSLGHVQATDAHPQAQTARQ